MVDEVEETRWKGTLRQRILSPIAESQSRAVTITRSCESASSLIGRRQLQADAWCGLGNDPFTILNEQKALTGLLGRKTKNGQLVWSKSI
jgi:hypothetical protein